MHVDYVLSSRPMAFTVISENNYVSYFIKNHENYVEEALSLSYTSYCYCTHSVLT